MKKYRFCPGAHLQVDMLVVDTSKNRFAVLPCFLITFIMSLMVVKLLPVSGDLSIKLALS